MLPLHRFDRRLTDATKKLPRPIRSFMESITFLGEPVFVLLVGSAGFLSAAVRHQRQIERAFLYAAVAYIIGVLLKLGLRRARPENLDIRTFGMKSYSFPSGHAFGTVIFYGLFSYLDMKYLAHPWNFVIGALLWLGILSIGISRIYVKAHYPSDVLGGWLLGFISLVAVIGFAF